MKPRVCMCCGELMAEGGNPMSRNPNMCASCSSLADGMNGDSTALDLKSRNDFPPESVEAEQPVFTSS